MSSKIESIKAAIAKLQVKLDAAVKAAATTITADKIKAGDAVDFAFGKGDESKVLKGTVLGVVVPAEGAKGGTLVRILTGEGVNTRVVSVFVSAIKSIPVAEEAPAVEAA